MSVSMFYAFGYDFISEPMNILKKCVLLKYVLLNKELESEEQTKILFLNSLSVPGAVLIDQYCNPLSDICLTSVQAQVDDITDKVRKALRTKNPRHPSLTPKAGTVEKCGLVGPFRVMLLVFMLPKQCLFCLTYSIIFK